MIDHLDAQTNDWLENGTRGDFIFLREAKARWEPGISADAIYDLITRPSGGALENAVSSAITHGVGAFIVDGASAEDASDDFLLFDTITTPVDSTFHCSPLADPEPIVRPPTEPPKKSHKADRYGRSSVKRVEFISYKAIEEFCAKVGEL